MIVYETVFVYDERRYRMRHGLEVDIPGGPRAGGNPLRAVTPAHTARSEELEPQPSDP